MIRSCTTGKLTESGFSDLSQRACVNNAIRLWKKAPTIFLKCTNFYNEINHSNLKNNFIKK